MSLESELDVLDDATHASMDEIVFNTFDDEPSSLPLATLLLATIVSISEGILDIKYKENPNAKALLLKNPWLIDELIGAWRDRTYKKIRNLRVLHSSISPSSSQTSELSNTSNISSTSNTTNTSNNSTVHKMSGLHNVLNPSSSSFIRLAKGRLFVDKSLALADFLREDNPVHLLLRPRRSGKTTLLDMFRVFFQRTNPAEATERKDLFKSNNLAISRDDRFDVEFGRYPVLYLDLSNVTGLTLHEFLQEYKSCVCNIVKQLKRDGFLKSVHELDEYDEIFLTEVLTKRLPDSEWRTALFQLTRLLHTLNKREVIVLIDEYDTPTSCAVQHGYFPEVNEFFRKTFSLLLKNNEYIRGALLVGILRVAKAGWLSGLNNLSVYPLGETARYATACMFTKEEVVTLCNRQQEVLRRAGETLSFTFEELEKWYNGYFTWDGAKLFNPWSVGKALTENRLDFWWNKSGYDDIIQNRIVYMLNHVDEFREQFNSLLDDEMVYIDIEEEMSYSPVPELLKSELWTLIYYAGYLAKVSIYDPDSPNDVNTVAITNNIGNNASRAIAVTIPNHEIRSSYYEWLRVHITEYIVKHHLGTLSVDLFRFMMSGSMSLFAEGFGQLVLTEMPGQFLGSKEVVYQSWVHGYIAAAAAADKAGPRWEVAVERHAGAGRLDLIIQGGMGASIQEYKRIKLTEKDKKEGYSKSKCKRLTEHANNALKQVEDRAYRLLLKKQVTDLHEYGVAFLGPYCAVVGQSLKRDHGGQWVIMKEYSVSEDKVRRQQMYTVT